MQNTDTVRMVLEKTGREIISVPPRCSVYDALIKMADEDIGALAVMHQGRLIGIFSERDYARKIVLLGRSSQETSVAEAMTMPPTCVAPDETVESCMRIMVANRSRHLFVREGAQLLGLVSIGDLVNWTISSQAETIGHLSSYIAGGYPG